MIDTHYTPITLAEKLVSFVENEEFSTIADFCVGNGSLLKAASNCWPLAKFFGIDISSQTINNLRKENPSWSLSICDFTNFNSRIKTEVIRKNKAGFDLILLNPPFSCKGSKRYIVNLDGDVYTVSTSMRFLVESMKYLSNKGKLLAIMPSSTGFSQKDSKIWKKLQIDYNLQVAYKQSVNHFTNCSPNIIIISVEKGKKKSTHSMNGFSLNIDNFKIIRGSISMHTLNGSHSDGYYLVHTTNMRNNKLVNLKRKIYCNNSIITGPALLIPRVGLPNPEKITIISENEKFAISDCILALKVKSNKSAKELKDLFFANWDKVKELYNGTGAKYTTIEKIENFLK